MAAWAGWRTGPRRHEPPLHLAGNHPCKDHIASKYPYKAIHFGGGGHHLASPGTPRAGDGQNSYVWEEWTQWSTPNMLERLNVEEEMEEDATFRELRQASSEAEKRLAEQIRAELGHPGRRSTAQRP